VIGAGVPAAVGPQGYVVLYSPEACSFSHAHERVTRTAIARRLAALKQFEFAGDYDPSRPYAAPVYFVPSDTLVGVQAVDELGIRSEHDLFGGVVPHAFVATKAITHPLVDPDAHSPAGWSHEFGRRVRDVVLFGFTAFTPDDARRAGLRVMEHGPVRIKPVRATGGHGQSVVSTPAELDAVLASMNSADLRSHGLVLEDNLIDVTTRSVGQVRVAELGATYQGMQCLTQDNEGATVYGGSEVVIVRGGFDALLQLDLPEEVRVAVAQARAYDAAVAESFAGMFASRRNYDVAQGWDAEGRWRSGVLEQSWRIGGMSSAEIAALEAFRSEPMLQAVRATCVEIYGESDPPPEQAIVYFRGTDEQIGPLTKYTLVQAYDDAR
jgi:hypothetical protein